MIPLLRFVWVIAALAAGISPWQQASTHPDPMITPENVGQVVQLAALQGHETAVYGATWSPDSEWVVFNSSRDGDYEIFVMRPDGSDVRQLTDNAARDFWPSWSPDGSRIVFVSERDGNAEIYVMNADGSDQRRLTDYPAGDWEPAWSPDGTQIVFAPARGAGRDAEIYIMNADGSDPVALTDNQRHDCVPNWSPDGTRIAFTSQRDGNFEIYVMNVDGSDPVRLTDEPGEDISPAWSPDGSSLVFVSDRDGDSDIYVMDADGGHVRQVTNNTGEDMDPRWSPDGSQIIFDAAPESHRGIHIVNLDGSSQQRISGDQGDDSVPDWVLIEPPSGGEIAASPAVLLVFGQQFIPSIYQTEVPLLEEAGYVVRVASHTLDPLHAKQSNLQVQPDLLLADVRVEDYEAIIFNCDNDITFGTAMEETNRIAQEAVAQDKVVGAICSGPRVLANAGVVRGRTVTGEPSKTCRMLENQGAICTGAQIERDGLMITARDRYAANLFTQKILEALAETANHAET